MESKTLTIEINRPPSEVYAFVSDGNNFPKWAKAFCLSAKPSGDNWIIETPIGRLTLRFSPRNEFGVLDHYVTLQNGKEVYVPLRVFPNGENSQVAFTLYRQPGMTDKDYAKDAEMVERDLRGLKETVEGK